MNTYYKTLGLEPGASQTDIKKAYFRLVRQHSPESDPEKFQQIREAYEQLKDAPNEPEGPVFPAFSEPFAEKMMQQIELYRKEMNLTLYRDACEEARKLFPDDIQFLYHLVLAQRRCGNTGKAVKNAELLVSKNPENKWYQRELAVSYMERGFTQKAYFALEKAYELGCRDLDFLLMYAGECYDYSEFDKALALLLEVVRQEKQWGKDEIPELIEVYTGLLFMNYHTKGTHLPEILEHFNKFLERYSIYLKDAFPELSLILVHMCTNTKQDSKEYELLQQIFSHMLRVCHDGEEQQIIQSALDSFNFHRILEDKRIGDTLAHYLEIFHQDTLDDDHMYRKFLITDYELCMIEERNDILKQAEIIHQEYPNEYENIKEFIHKLENADKLSFLKDSLLRTYYRLEPIFSCGTYYDNYPQEKKRAKGTVIHDGFSEPYVRPEKKIGRNDPCPCGSGKKYKHCCMNK